MAKLVVLSEVNNLEYLRKHGVYPSMFFTDIKTFEKMLSFFNGVKVCCILSGCCSFSRRKLNELFDFLQERIDDSESSSIEELLIFSDTDTFKRDFYRYTTSIGCVNLMSGTKTKRVGLNPWKGFQFEPVSNTIQYLRDEHKGIVSSSLKSYHDRVESKKSEIEDMLQRPNVV